MEINCIQIMTTTSRREEAERIALSLVEKRFAASVQIIEPVTSIYRWQGKVENTMEWLCLIKTTPEMYNSVEKEILSLHSYKVAEIIALPIIAGSELYLHWLNDNVETAD